MMEVVSKIAEIIKGRSAVPAIPGVMGPQQPSEGLFGGDWMSWLSGGLTLASAGASIFAGEQSAEATMMNARQQQRALELDIREQELEAQREEVRGKQDANNRNDELMRTISAQRAAYAANGLDIDFGTPVMTGNNARDAASRQLSVSREDARIRSLSRRRQAAALREESNNVLASAKATASNTRLQGGIGALSAVTDLVQRRVDRG